MCKLGWVVSRKRERGRLEAAAPIASIVIVIPIHPYPQAKAKPNPNDEAGCNPNLERRIALLPAGCAIVWGNFRGTAHRSLESSKGRLFAKLARRMR